MPELTAALPQDSLRISQTEGSASGCSSTVKFLYSPLEQDAREGEVLQFWMLSETIYYTLSMDRIACCDTTHKFNSLHLISPKQISIPIMESRPTTIHCQRSHIKALQHRLHPVHISTLSGWNAEAHRAVLSLVATITSRLMIAFATRGDILFQRHAALLINSNAACLLSGWCVPV